MSDETNDKPDDPADGLTITGDNTFEKREPKHVYGTATGTAVGRGAAKPDGG